MRECRWMIARVLAGLTLLAFSAQPASAQTDKTDKLAHAGTGVGLVFVQQWSAPGFGVDFSQEIAKFWRIRTSMPWPSSR